MTSHETIQASFATSPRIRFLRLPIGILVVSARDQVAVLELDFNAQWARATRIQGVPHRSLVDPLR